MHNLSDPLRNHHPITLSKSYLISHYGYLLDPKHLIFLQLEKKVIQTQLIVEAITKEASKHWPKLDRKGYDEKTISTVIVY